MALACGFLCALCFDITWLAPFLWVLLAPFFVILLREKRKKRVLGLAAVFCAALFLCYYAAFFTLDIISRAGDMAGVYLVFGWLGVSLLQGAILMAAIFAGAAIPCRGYLRAPLMGILWTGAEWLLGAGVLGLPCVRLGATQWTFLPAMQSARLGGVLFISMLIVMVSVLLAQGLLARKKSALRQGWYFMAAALLFSANFIFGSAALNSPDMQGEISVAAVQYNVPFSENEGQGRFEKGMHMAGEAAQKKTDLILLPENSVYGSLMEDRKLSGACADITRVSDGYLFLGVYGIHGYELRNSVFMVAPDGSVADVYHKQRLVPFFENGYEKTFDFEVGSERGVFETGYGKVGSMICFESLFTDVASDTVRRGAQLLCVFTNDSWFRGDIPLNRHFAQSAMRAVETGRYLVQAGNTGVSAIVTPHGTVAEKLPVNTERILYGKVAFLQGTTPYVWIGDWWILAFLAAVGVIWLAGRKKRI